METMGVLTVKAGHFNDVKGRIVNNSLRKMVKGWRCVVLGGKKEGRRWDERGGGRFVLWLKKCVTPCT